MKFNNLSQKVISILLVFALLMSAFPLQAFADTENGNDSDITSEENFVEEVSSVDSLNAETDSDVETEDDIISKESIISKNENVVAGSHIVAAAAVYTEFPYTYSVNDGKATITKADSSISGAVIVPDHFGEYPVVAIGNGAFKNCMKMTSVKLPETVTSIASYAFQNCSIESVELPDSLTEIGSYGFNNCSRLQSVCIPSSVISVGNYAFANCTALSDLRLSDYGDEISVIENDGHYYAVFANLMNWDNAESYCESVGGHLVTITSETENTFVSGLIMQTLGDNDLSVLCGASDAEQEGVWKWVTGEEWNYSNWNSGEPNNQNGNQDHLRIYHTKNNTKWDDINATSESLYYVCEWDAVPEKNSLVWQISVSLSDAGLNFQSVTIGSYAFSNLPSLQSVFVPSRVSSCGTSPFYNCSALQTVIFADNMDKIPQNICSELSSLTEIIIPEHVTSIGNSAFRCCSSLRKVVIPASVKEIDNYAFGSCTSLNELILSNGLTKIGSYAFCSTFALKTLTIPASVTSMGTTVFADSGIEKVIFSDGIQEIPNSALDGAAAVTEIQLPDSVTSIGEFAFRNCCLLKEITLPSQLQAIGRYAFHGCSALATVTLPAALQTIESYAFCECYSLATICFDNSSVLNTIETHAFDSCRLLNHVTLPTSLNQLGSYVFSGCVSLDDIVLNEGLTKIGDGAFGWTSRLKSITIPSTVTSMGSGIFNSDSAVEKVIFAEGMQTIPSHALYDCKNVKEIVFPSTLQKIDSNAFYNCISLVNIDFPLRLRTIGSNAFYGCYGLQTLSFSQNIETINNSAFANCRNLTEITLDSSLLTIGENSFSGCTRLQCVSIPKSVQTIGSYAFRNCYALQTVTFAENAKLKSINSYAFADCQSLQSVTLPASLTSVNVYCFSGCRSLKTVEFASDCITVPSYALYGAESVETIILPQTCKTIENYAFYGCTSLKNIVIPGKLRTIGEYAFCDCDSMTSIDLVNCEAIGQYAFYKCDNLADVDFGDELDTVGYYAFGRCVNLTSVDLPSTTKTIADYSFAMCPNLRDVFIRSMYINISKKSFYNDVNLTVYCDSDSDAYTFAVEMEYETSQLPTVNKITNNLNANKTSDYSMYLSDTPENIIQPETQNESDFSLPEENADINTVDTDDASIENNNNGLLSHTYIPAVSVTVPEKVGASEETESYDETSGVYYIGSTITGAADTVVELRIPAELNGVTVTAIADSAFAGNTKLETITFPDSLITIGSEAFENCTELYEVNLNDTVREIGYRAFYGCSQLKQITIPTSICSSEINIFEACSKLVTVTFKKTTTNCIPANILYNCESVETIVLPDEIYSIGTGAFYKCSSLETVELPNELRYVKSDAFYGCTHLLNITVPAAVLSIGESAFRQCTRLRSIIFADDAAIHTISGYVFADCSSLESFVAPSSLCKIGNYAFSNCVSMEELTLNEGLLSIGSNAFEKCSYIRSVVIPSTVYTTDENIFSGCNRLVKASFADGIVRIPANIFYGCTALSEVIIPDSVLRIGSYAFYGCTDLCDVTLSQTLLFIGDYAFKNCKSLKKIDIPASVLRLMDYCFEGCTKLASVNFDKGARLYAIGSYAFKNCDALESFILPEYVTCLYEGAFAECDSLKTITFNDNIYKLGCRAFYKCTSLSAIVIPAQITSMDTEIFAGCTKLLSVTFDDGMLRIPENALYGCKNVETVIIPESVYCISENAFRNCTSLNKIDISGVRYINDSAFYGCTELKEMEFGEKTENIASNAFQDCKKLSKVTFSGNSLDTIGSEAFRNCSALTQICIPACVASVDNYAFYACSSLQTVQLNEGLRSIGYRAFGNDSALMTISLIPATVSSMSSEIFVNDTLLTSVGFADGTTDIPENALYNCKQITDITLPSTVKTIGSQAFCNCIGLTSVTLDENITYIGSDAFYGCTGLKTVCIKAKNPTICTDAFAQCSSLQQFSLSSQCADAITYGHNISCDLWKDIPDTTAIIIGSPLSDYDNENPTLTWNGHVYSLCYVSDGITWEDAADECLAQGAHLVTVGSRGEELIVELLTIRSGVSDGTWLYGTDEEKEGTWVYPNGDDFICSFWDDNQPDDYYGEEDYLEYCVSYGAWNDASGTSTVQAYICEWDGAVGDDITLTVFDSDGNDVTNTVTVNWYKQGSLTTSGNKLRNYNEEESYAYDIILNDTLGKQYYAPSRQTLKNIGETNQVTFTLTPIVKTTVSGRVTTNDGKPLAGAALSFVQTCNEKYESTVTGISDADGKYSVTLYDVPTVLTVTADEYYTRKLDNVQADFGGVMSDIIMKPLTKSRLSFTVLLQSAAPVGEMANTENVSDISNLDFTLYNMTQEKPITGFAVQYPYIILDDASLQSGDNIRISVTDKTGSTEIEDTVCTLDELLTGSFCITQIENGKLALGTVTGTDGIWMVFDENGRYTATYSTADTDVSATLPAGNYRVVFMQKTDLLRKVSDLSRLSEIGLQEGTDYSVQNCAVENGTVAVLDAVEIQELNQEKLYYTVSEDTSFTASRYALTQGKLMTLRAEYSIKNEYTAKNPYILLDLPEGITFIQNSVTLDGTLCDYIYDADENTVKVYTNAKKAIVRCSVSPVAVGTPMVDAFLGFELGSDRILQPIGSFTVDVSALSFELPEKTGRKKIQVNGIGLTCAAVQIYDNGVLAATTESNRGGNWETEVELSGSDMEYTEHKIYAVLTSKTLGYSVTSDTKTLVFDPDYVNLSKVTMINTAHPSGTLNTCEFVTEIDFLNPTDKTLSYNYWPNYPTFTFNVEFTTDNPNLISDVYAVTQNASGDFTYVPCTYNASTGTWVGTHDYTNSFQKPAAVTAVYNYNEPRHESLLTDTLWSVTDIADGDLYLTRIYSSDSESFSETGLFGFGWKTEYDIIAQKIHDDESDYIYVSGPDIAVLAEKQKDGSYRSVTKDGITVFEADNGITVTMQNGTVLVFNENGQISSMTDTEGKSVSLYYNNGNPERIVSDDGSVLEFSYENGLVSTVTSGDGSVAAYTYSGGFLTRIDINGQSEYYSYNADLQNKSANALTKIEDEKGQTVFYTFDSFGRVLTVGDSSGNKTEYTYSGSDSVSALLSSGLRTDCVFDEYGYLISYSDSAGLKYEVTYSDTYQVTGIKYGDGTEYSFVYDSSDNLVSATQKDTLTGKSVSTGATYDEAGNITGIVDENGNKISYVWNENGKLTSIVYPDGTDESYKYDENDSITEKTGRDGEKISYTYSNGEVTNISAGSDDSVAMEYDDSGRVIKAVTAGEETSIFYDDAGRISAIVYPGNKTVSYTYNTLGRLTSVTDSEGVKTKYQYDSFGRVVRVTDDKGTVLVTYSYNPDSTVAKKTNGNGTYTEYTYADSMVTGISNYSAAGEILSFFAYTYDTAGNITEKRENSGTWKYTYDYRSQLIGVTEPDGTVISYTYDAAGNRLTETIDGVTTAYTTNTSNEYTAVGDTLYSYDKNGNLSSVKNAEKTVSYTYDSFGRLIKTTDGDSVTEYGYDVFGNRNSVSVNGVTTEYVWSPIGIGNIVAAYTADGKVYDYIYGSLLAGVLVDGEMYYYNTDLPGSVSEITDISGIAVNTYTYNAFGAVTSETEKIFNPFTFLGANGITEYGEYLYNIRSRDYSVITGSFIEPDSSGQYYSLNVYCYADNNPVSNADITGDFVLTACICGAVVSGLVSVGTDMAYDYITTGQLGSWQKYAISGATGAIAGGLTGGLGSGLSLAGKVGISAGKAFAKSALTQWLDPNSSGFSWLKVADDTLFGAATSLISEKLFKADWFKNIDKLKWNEGIKKLTESGAGFVKNLLGYMGKAGYDFLNGLAKKFIKAGLNGLFGDLYDWLRKVFGIDDPSGYIYEAVLSNRVQGVTVTAYTLSTYTDDYDEQQQETVLWDASEFNQENPLISDAFGQYAWDVPTGKWQVKYEKDGYETAYSDWLDVPPPQTDVNIGLVSTASPEIESISAYNDGIEIRFTQYMDLTTITADSITVSSGGKSVSGTITALNAEESGADPDVSYASQFLFTPSGDAKLTGTASVMTKNVKNYAGTAMSGTSAITAKVTVRPTAITGASSMEADTGAVIRFTVRVDSGSAAQGSVLAVSSVSPSIASPVQNTVIVDKDGNAVIEVQTKLPGSAEIVYTMEGTSVSGKTVVTVDMPQEITEESFTDSETARMDINGNIIMKAVTKSEILLAQCPADSVIKDTTGFELTDTRLPGSGMTVVFPDQSEHMILIYGDVDGDGQISAADARLALRRSVNLESSVVWRDTVCDVDNTTGVTAADARLILRAAVKLEDASLWFKQK